MEETQQPQPLSADAVRKANELATANIKLARKFARVNRVPGLDVEEVESIAMEGLVAASRHYDPSKAAFSTFAWRCMQSKLWRLNQDAKTLSRGGGKIKTFQRGVDREGETFDVEDESSGSDHALHDAKDAIAAGIGKLCARDRRIVHARFFEDKTLAEVGQEVGVSKERIRQIELACLKKLKRRSWSERDHRGTKVELVCTSCGRTFLRRKAQVEHRQREGKTQFFCTNGCYGKWQSIQAGQKPWTPADIDIVKAMCAAGSTDKEIAARLGRSRVAVTSMRMRTEARKVFKWTDEQRAFLRQNARHMRAAAIAEQIGKTIGAVRLQLYLMGLTKKNWKTFTPEGCSKATALLANGKTDREIANALGCTPAAVEHWRRRNSLPVNRVGAEERKRLVLMAMQKQLGGLAVGTVQRMINKRAAQKLGWPEAGSKKQAIVLELLSSGPKTRREIANHLGVSPSRSKNFFTVNSLVKLLSTGLVVNCGRIGGGNLNALYDLSAKLKERFLATTAA